MELRVGSFLLKVGMIGATSSGFPHTLPCTPDGRVNVGCHTPDSIATAAKLRYCARSSQKWCSGILLSLGCMNASL